MARIIAFIGAAGILLFLVTATILPFKDQVFNYLYPKPFSKALDPTTLTIEGINASNNTASLDGFNFSWNTGTINLTDGAYAVMFVTTKDDQGNILDQHWLVGPQATEGLNFKGSYTFPAAGTAVITVWETNNVECSRFNCDPNLAVHNSQGFTVPRIISPSSPTPTPIPTITPTSTPTPFPSSSPSFSPTPPATLGKITGTVYSSSGGVVVDAKIAVNNGRKTFYSSLVGTYTIPNLAPDAYNLTFQAKNHFNQSITVTVSAGQTALGDVVMRRK